MNAALSHYYIYYPISLRHYFAKERKLPRVFSSCSSNFRRDGDLGRSRAQSRKLRLAGTHEVERGFAGNCQAGGSIMSTGFGEPITPDPSQKRSRTPRRDQGERSRGMKRRRSRRRRAGEDQLEGGDGREKVMKERF